MADSVASSVSSGTSSGTSRGTSGDAHNKQHRRHAFVGWWERQHHGLWAAAAVLVLLAAVTVIVLWQLGVGPFHAIRPVRGNLNDDDRVLLHAYNTRNGTNLKKLPQAVFDPNGFHALWAALPTKSKGNSQSSQATVLPQVIKSKICEPCWDNDEQSATYASFQMGWETVDTVTLANMASQYLHDSPTGVPSDAQNETWWKKLCGVSTLSSDNSETINACKANFVTQNPKTGAITGVQNWGTGGGSSYITALKDSSNPTGLAKLCPIAAKKLGLPTGPSKITCKACSGISGVPTCDSTTDTDVSGNKITLTKPLMVPGASEFMQCAFNACWYDALRGFKSSTGETVYPVKNPSSVCSHVVLQPVASGQGTQTYKGYTEAWMKLRDDREALSKAHNIQCQMATPKSPTATGTVQSPGGCVRLCRVDYVPPTITPTTS